MRDLEEARECSANALVHLLPEVEVVRIERVVEIEHQVSVAEGAGAGRTVTHGELAIDP